MPCPSRSPGGFESTVAGIRNLLGAEISTGLIFVLCAANTASLPDYVRFVAGTFGPLPVFCSYVTPYFDPTLPADIVPAYSESVPHVLEAFRLAEALGVPISFMEEQHGIPECILPNRGKYFRNLFAPMSPRRPAGFVKKDICSGCAEDANCPGVRKYYALLRGMDEIKPIKTRNG